MRNQFIKDVAVTDALDQSQIFNSIDFNAINSTIKGIIVTPVCDLANEGRTHFYNFCAVLPFRKLFFTIAKEKADINEHDFARATIAKQKKNNIVSHVKLILNNQVVRYHWLGEVINNGELFYVDYQLIQSVSISKISEIIQNRIAKIDSPLKESIYVRFSNYLGRVGLPGDNEEKLRQANEIFEQFKTS